MELLQLRYFYKIAHSRTLTQAADELCISQSSLSRMIGRLEDEFEMEFFDRKGRKIELNENGRIFLRYCTQILNAVDSMRDELSEMKNRRDMAVSVGFYSMSSLIVDIMGKSELSKMSPFQMVIAFMIAELAAIPIDSPDASLINGVIAIAMLMFLQVFISFLTTKSEGFKVFIRCV